MLLSGEAGVGKSRLADEAAAAPRALVLRGAAADSVTHPVRADRRGAALAPARRARRRSPTAGRCARTWRCCCPSSASRPPRATARRSSRRSAAPSPTSPTAARRSSSSTTCSGPTRRPSSCWRRSPRRCARCRCWSIGAYRSDGLPRDHRLRWLRNELRRGGLLEELALEPLDRDADGGAAARACSPSRPRRALARTVHDRTQGSPFFVEELVAALRVRGALHAGPRGLELAEGGEVPVPDTVRDAVLIGASELSRARRARRPRRRRSPASPSTSGSPRSWSSEAGLAELLDAGLLAEDGRRARRLPPRADARRALRRGAVDAPPRAAPPLRRGARRRAAAPSSRSRPTGSAPASRARAREALRAGRCGSPRPLHAHRDAARPARAGARALVGGRSRGRCALETLERYAPLRRAGRRAGRGGESAGASSPRSAIAPASASATPRPSAGWPRVYELSGERDAAFAARRLAAEAFAAGGTARRGRARAAGDGRPPAAAAPATGRRSSWREAAVAATHRGGAGRPAALARSGCSGVAQAKGGEFERRAWRRSAAALALALEHDLTPVAAELYQRLSLVLYDARRLPPAPRRRSTPRSASAAPAATPAPRSPASPASSTCCASAASGRAPASSAAS